MQQALSNDVQQKLQWSLLALRLGVFVVMLVWTIDKFVNPSHSMKIFEKFYSVSGMSEIAAYILGGLQLVLLLAFGLGIKKRITYGVIFLMHGASTLSAFNQYFDAFNNLLFFAAWPMLAACFTLYMLREEDTKFTVK